MNVVEKLVLSVLQMRHHFHYCNQKVFFLPVLKNASASIFDGHAYYVEHWKGEIIEKQYEEI